MNRTACWTVEEYLELQTNQLIEFTDGFLEMLPSPDEIHVLVHAFIRTSICHFIKIRGNGVVMYAPFKVRVSPAAFREPDVCVLLDKNDPRRGRKYWGGADLVIEVVSPGGESRDYVDKRSDYAAGNIPKYWIVDPAKKEVLILRLSQGAYVVQGPLRPERLPNQPRCPAFGSTWPPVSRRPNRRRRMMSR